MKIAEIKEIQKCSFPREKHIALLNFRENELTKFDIGCFSKCIVNSMLTVDLTENSLSSVIYEQVRGRNPPNISELVLDNNRIGENGLSLHSNLNLTRISLRKNELTRLDTINWPIALQEVDISDNAIEDLTPLVNRLPCLRKLKAPHNRLIVAPRLRIGIFTLGKFINY